MVKFVVQGEFSGRDASFDLVQNCLHVAVKNNATPDSLVAGVNGCPGEVTSVGTLFGPYTLDQIKAGVSVSVPAAAGTSTIKILGLDADQCETSTLAQVMQRQPRELGWYEVASGETDLTSQTRLSLTNALTPTTLNRFRLCEPVRQANGALRLSIIGAYLGYSGGSNSSLVFANGEGANPPRNPGGSAMRQIPLGKLRNTYHAILPTEGGGYFHPRVDLIASLKGIDLTGVIQQYSLTESAEFASYNISVDGGGCGTGSPSGLEYTGLLGLYLPFSGTWQNAVSNISGQVKLTFDNVGNAQTIALDPQGTRGLLYSLRANRVAIPNQCAALRFTQALMEFNLIQTRR